MTTLARPKRPWRAKSAPRIPLRGASTVEFALVSLVFFMVLFGLIEVGRMAFTYNTLEEAVRRGARVGAVCPINHSGIQTLTVGGRNDGTGYTLSGLTSEMVNVDYLGQTGAVVGNPAANVADVFFVRVRISGYQHRFLVPGLNRVFNGPVFEAVLPVESLGAVPTGVGEATVAPQCYGTTS